MSVNTETSSLIKDTSNYNPDGTRLGQAAADLIGFYGITTPIARRSGSAQGAVTKTITTLASMLEMQVGNEQVVPSDNFNEWNARRLKLLATMMTSFVEQNIRDKEKANEDAVLATNKLNAYITSISEVETKSNETVAIAEAKIVTLGEQVKTLNKILATFHEQECFVVARIDSVTKEPVKFFLDTGEEIRQTSKLTQALKLSSREKARNFRSEVISSLFTRASRLEALHLHDEIIIMQVSLSYVPILNIDD